MEAHTGGNRFAGSVYESPTASAGSSIMFHVKYNKSNANASASGLGYGFGSGYYFSIVPCEEQFVLVLRG